MSENKDIKDSGEGQPIEDYLTNLLGGGKPTPSEISSEKPSLLSEELPEEEEERSSRKRFSQAFGKKRAKEEGYGRLDEKKANKRDWWNGPIGCVVGLAAITGCSVITYCSTQGIIRKLFEGMDWEKPAISEPITFDQEGRSARQAEFSGEMTIAHDLKNGVWPERTGAEQLLGSLDPYTNDYDQWMAFVEWCGPQCFLDPNWIPEQGRPAVMDLLGVDEKGYKHYQQHPEGLSAHLRQLYPDKPWLADLFNIHPTLLGLDGKSDFELWKERYPQGQSNLTPGIPLSMLGKPIIKNSLGGVEQRLDRVALGQNRIREKGRGFGTTKGFS